MQTSAKPKKATLKQVQGTISLHPRVSPPSPHSSGTWPVPSFSRKKRKCVSNIPGLAVHCLKDWFLFHLTWNAHRTRIVLAAKSKGMAQQLAAASLALQDWENMQNLRETGVNRASNILVSRHAVKRLVYLSSRGRVMDQHGWGAWGLPKIKERSGILSMPSIALQDWRRLRACSSFLTEGEERSGNASNFLSCRKADTK